MENHKRKKQYVTPVTETVEIPDLMNDGLNVGTVDDPGAKGHNASWDEEDSNLWNNPYNSTTPVGSSALSSAFKKTSLWDE